MHDAQFADAVVELQGIGVAGLEAAEGLDQSGPLLPLLVVGQFSVRGRCCYRSRSRSRCRS